MAGRRRPPDPSEVFAASPAESLRALAGPGTGKTFALIRRLARLLEEGVAPRRILVVTFARTAARDLVAAVARLGEAAAEDLAPRTLNVTVPANRDEYDELTDHFAALLE